VTETRLIEQDRPRSIGQTNTNKHYSITIRYTTLHDKHSTVRKQWGEDSYSVQIKLLELLHIPGN
jgi:hypothetical protein